MSKAIYDDVMGDRDDKPRVTDSLAPDYEQSEAPSVVDLVATIWASALDVINSDDFKDEARYLKARAKTLDHYSAKINRLIVEKRLEWLDEQILHLLNDIYPEDVFTPPTKEDFDRVNEFDANLHTRLHCDGIRHGLHVLRREVRGLSARDDLSELSNNLSKGDV